MTLSLHEQGVFTWQEWATLLNDSICKAQQAGDPDLGDTYYSYWLSALEHMNVQKEIGSQEQLARLHENWNQAAEHTPHGQPIEHSRP